MGMANFRLSLGLALLAFAFFTGVYTVFSDRINEEEAIFFLAAFVFLPVLFGSWLTASIWQVWLKKAGD
jgi:hypothetical protein